jgi:AcrR family transcriptional regulator
MAAPARNAATAVTPRAARAAAPARARRVAPASPTAQRREALNDARRALVLDAAREVFHAQGLDGANIREIARRAGYTPGAIYSYFDSKEAIYGALLAESLERLNGAVADALAAVPEPDAAAALRAGSLAWFNFYHQAPRDLELGFYLVQGLAQRGLTPALNRQLNQRLHDALAPDAQALQALGLPPEAARAEATALFAQGVGLLLLHHTGRIRLFGQDAAVLFGHALDALLARVAAAAPRRPRKTMPTARRSR